MDQKPEIIFFSEYKIGGVQNYYYNLITNDPFNKFDKKWIFTDEENETEAKLPFFFNVVEEVLFRFNRKKSIYPAIAELNKLISNRPGVVMVNNPVELIALHKQRKTNKTIFSVCHDELYITNALKYEFLIDVFIAHNYFFYEELIRLLPKERKNDIYYLPYGIKLSNRSCLSPFVKNLKVIFIGRLNEKKGIYDLAVIDDHLKDSGIEVFWTIVGRGPEEKKLKEQLLNKSNFTFISPDTTEEILEIASQHNIFILPSYLDGLPVALLEAMSVGLVPVISNFNEGIKRVVTPETGFIVPVANSKAFADKIAILHNDRYLLETLGKKALKKIEDDYDIKKRVKSYYELFDKFRELKKPERKKFLKYDGLLDYPFIPQVIRDLLRKLKN